MGEAKGLIITVIVTIILVGAGIFFLSKSATSSKPVIVDQSILIRANSHQTNPGAKVNIVEFGDYRCPACDQAFPVTQELIKDYGNKINFVFRNYAFLPDSETNQTPNASNLAANAAECASDQNMFWQMHDYFYQNQPPETDISMYTPDNLTKIAQNLGLDISKFKTCLLTKTDDNRVKADYADGQLAGVTGTPSFFVNGTLLPGIPGLSDFKNAIDPLLAK